MRKKRGSKKMKIRLENGLIIHREPDVYHDGVPLFYDKPIKVLLVSATRSGARSTPFLGLTIAILNGHVIGGEGVLSDLIGFSESHARSFMQRKKWLVLDASSVNELNTELNTELNAERETQ